MKQNIRTSPLREQPKRKESPKKFKDMIKKYVGSKPPGKPVEITSITTRNIYAET